MLQLLNDVNASALVRAFRQFPAKGSTLDLDFLNNRSRVAGVYGTALAAATATRSTTATYWDSAGVLQTAAINEPILFEYDQALRRLLGLRILGQSRNEYINSATLSTQSVAVTAQQYTVSFVGTGTIALSGASTAGPLVGVDSNTRVSLTFTPTAGTLVSTVSGTVSNAQLQAGALFDSYIPTGASAETRAGDVIGFTGTNFSSWYNQVGGVIVCEFSLIGLVEAQTLYHFGFGGFDDRISVRNDSARLVHRVISSSTPQVTIIGQPLAANTVVKSVFSVFPNAASVCENGRLTDEDKTVSLPSPNSLQIGGAFGAPTLNGYIRRLTYFPNPLPQNIRQYLSRPS